MLLEGTTVGDGDTGGNPAPKKRTVLPPARGRGYRHRQQLPRRHHRRDHGEHRNGRQQSGRSERERQHHDSLHLMVSAALDTFGHADHHQRGDRKAHEIPNTTKAEFDKVCIAATPSRQPLVVVGPAGSVLLSAFMNGKRNCHRRYAAPSRRAFQDGCLPERRRKAPCTRSGAPTRERLTQQSAGRDGSLDRCACERRWSPASARHLLVRSVRDD